jgi:hypothetical protein
MKSQFDSFNNIEGYSDIKDIIGRALDAKDKERILLLRRVIIDKQEAASVAKLEFHRSRDKM